MIEGRLYTTKTDMWSLGCLLHEACTLKFPHHRVLLQLSLMPDRKPFDGDTSATVLANIKRLKRHEISTFYDAVIRKLVERLLKLEVSAGGYSCLRNNQYFQYKHRPSAGEILAMGEFAYNIVFVS